jgi:hypothetical protein
VRLLSKIENRLAVSIRGIFLFLRIRDLGRNDFPVECERCLVEIFFRDGRAEIAADLRAVVGGTKPEKSMRNFRCGSPSGSRVKVGRTVSAKCAQNSSEQSYALPDSRWMLSLASTACHCQN